jgi:hypothetical protein
VGDRELPGGDPTFALKMRTYWTLVGTPTRPLQTWWPAVAGMGVVLLVVALLTWWLIRRARLGKAAGGSRS